MGQSSFKKISIEILGVVHHRDGSLVVAQPGSERAPPDEGVHPAQAIGAYRHAVADEELHVCATASAAER